MAKKCRLIAFWQKLVVRRKWRTPITPLFNIIPHDFHTLYCHIIWVTRIKRATLTKIIGTFSRKLAIKWFSRIKWPSLCWIYMSAKSWVWVHRLEKQSKSLIGENKEQYRSMFHFSITMKCKERWLAHPRNTESLPNISLDLVNCPLLANRNHF